MREREKLVTAGVVLNHPSAPLVNLSLENRYIYYQFFE